MSSELYPPPLQAIEQRRCQLLALVSRCKSQLIVEDDPKRQLKLEQDIQQAEQTLEQETAELCRYGLSVVRERKAKLAYENALATSSPLYPNQPSASRSRA